MLGKKVWVPEALNTRSIKIGQPPDRAAGLINYVSIGYLELITRPQSVCVNGHDSAGSGYIHCLLTMGIPSD
jgi:hypothetical protein